MHYREISPALPPLPADLVTSEDDPSYAGQGYSRSARAEHLKEAHFHAREAVKFLENAIDMLDDEALGPEDDDDIEPMDFGDEYDNQQTEQARRAVLMVLRSLA
jgi:hypothetical protein